MKHLTTLIIAALMAAGATAQQVTVFDTTIGNRAYSYKVAYPVTIDTAGDELILSFNVMKYITVDGDTLQNHIVGMQVNAKNQQRNAIKEQVTAVIQGRLKNKARKLTLKQESK